MAFQVQDNKNIATNQFRTISHSISVSFILGNFKSKLELPAKGKGNGTILRIIYAKKIQNWARTFI